MAAKMATLAAEATASSRWEMSTSQAELSEISPTTRAWPLSTVFRAVNYGSQGFTVAPIMAFSLLKGPA